MSILQVDTMETDDIVTRLRDNASHLRRIGYTSDAKEVADAADEIERLRANNVKMINHLKEMLPLFITDVRQGISIGPSPDGHDNDFCPDCQWYKKSVEDNSRIIAGEFDYIQANKD